MNINELLLSTELYNLLKVIFEPITFFTDTNKRLYLGYFLGCIVIITTVYGLQSIKFKALVKASFSKHYWLNQSSLIDVQWLFVNQAIKGVIVIPLFLSQISLTMSVYRWLTDVFGVGNFLTHTKSTVIILFTLALFVVDDFSRFFIHYLYHKVPFLWRFHSIHHSANVLTPITLYRVHFVEYLLNTMRSILVAGLLGGIFIYSFTAPIGVIEILGVSFFTFLFNLFGANLRHSHVHISFHRLEKLFISPAQHQIHHSSEKAYLDKNFGSCLAIWDRLFNSWMATSTKRVKHFGLYQQAAPQKISRQLLGFPVIKK